MYFIAAFGLLMMCLSIVMIVNPEYWSNGIVKFSKKNYFHWFEIVSRLASGIVFILYHESTLYPLLILNIGYLLIAVSVGLLLIGSVKHRKFAVWSAHKCKNIFRPSGIGAFMFGIFLLQISILA